jgi:hypothetical protein
MCGQVFLLRTTMLRHFYAELPAFRAAAQANRAAYEVERRRYRMAHPLAPASVPWSIDTLPEHLRERHEHHPRDA